MIRRVLIHKELSWNANLWANSIFQAFFEQHEFEDCHRVIQQTLEVVKINVDRWNREGAAISEFLIGLNQEKA